MRPPRDLSIDREVTTMKKEEPANKTEKECPETEEALVLVRLLRESVHHLIPKQGDFPIYKDLCFSSSSSSLSLWLPSSSKSI